jgi:hypothetical protein
MPAATYFGNRVVCKLLNDVQDSGSTTFTNGSATISAATPPAAGDYIYKISDGIQYAAKCLNGTTLAYTYKGTSGAGAAYHITPETLAVLRGLEMNVSWEVAELYGTDSIFRVDEAKHSLKAEAKIKYAKWNAGPTVDWTMEILRPTGKTGAVEDTNVCFVNGVVYSIVGTSATTMEIVCGKTYWEGLPYPFPENDFIVRDLTGKAKAVTFNSY